MKDSSELLLDNWAHLPEGYEKKWVQYFVLAQFMANLFVNIDMGILPASINKIESDLHIDDIRFGLLQTVIYVGQIVGSAFSSGLLTSKVQKWILCLCLSLNCVSLFLFTILNNFILLAACRCSTGLFQIPFAIYMPVFAETFGNEKQKSKWITTQLISSPIGVILGYGLSSILQNNIGWRWAFRVQIILQLPCILFMLILPPKYFDLNAKYKMTKADKTE